MGKEGKERKGGWERQKERKVKEQNGVVYWERRRKYVKEIKMHCLPPGRQIFFGPWSPSAKTEAFLCQRGSLK